jgi:molybdopterin-guanine dinucleotide biosynthesis protein A
MGRDKAFIAVDGVPLVRRVADELTRAGATEVRVTGGDRGPLEALGLIADPDPVPFAGPLAAVITSIEAARDDPVVVLACDLPGVSAAAVTATVEALGEADAAVPTDGERPQWLHGAWRHRCLPVLRRGYGAGVRAIHLAVLDLDVSTVTGIAPALLADVDRPADLASTTYPAAMDMAEIDVAELARRRERGVGSA